MTYVVVSLFIIIVLISSFSKAHTRKQKDIRSRFLINEDEPTDDDIKRVLDAGHKIYAIKLYRTKHGCGLKEAKEAVERIG